MPHVMLSESARAALASGADLETLPYQNVETDEAEEPKLEEETATAELSDDAVETETNLEAQADVPAPAQVSELTTYLQGEIKARDERIETLLVELASEKSTVKTLSAVESQLKPIAVAACQRMQVALGQSPGKLEDLSTQALAERYDELQSDFNARFKAGQTAETETEESRAGRPVDPRAARLSLVHGN